jgi:hypothetical protein
MSSSEVSAPGPVLILALPRSFSTVFSMMLGQHPELYGFPELHLFAAESLAEWVEMAASASFSMEHGLLRCLAQLFWKEQTEHTIQLARNWITRHLDVTTGTVFAALQKEIQPRIAVEKGPTLITRSEYMQRAYRLYPNARFIHLVRDPRSYGASVLGRIREEAARGGVGRWLLEMLYYPSVDFEERAVASADSSTAQRGWYEVNTSAIQFLRSIPSAQHTLLRGEDLLQRPRETLSGLAAWLGLRTDEDAISAMLHPERSPYACLGPAGASFGGDPHFLGSPVLRPLAASFCSGADPRAPTSSHVSPPPEAKQALQPDVARLAGELGYHV